VSKQHGNQAPHILYTGVKWKSVASFMLWLLYTHGQSPHTGINWIAS